jgi:hypothetical protein
LPTTYPNPTKLHKPLTSTLTFASIKYYQIITITRD